MTTPWTPTRVSSKLEAVGASCEHFRFNDIHSILSCSLTFKIGSNVKMILSCADLQISDQNITRPPKKREPTINRSSLQNYD